MSRGPICNKPDLAVQSVEQFLKKQNNEIDSLRTQLEESQKRVKVLEQALERSKEHKSSLVSYLKMSGAVYDEAEFRKILNRDEIELNRTLRGRDGIS